MRTTGGQSWGLTSGQPGFNYLNSQGNYSTALFVDPTTKDLFLGGQGDPVTGANAVLESDDGGASWYDITIDSNGNAPYPLEHAFTLDKQGRLLVVNDGGVWRRSGFGSGVGTTGTWTDLVQSVQRHLPFTPAV